MKTGGRAHLLGFVEFMKASGLTAALRQITTYHASAEPFARLMRSYHGRGPRRQRRRQRHSRPRRRAHL